MATRAAMHRAGAAVLEGLLDMPMEVVREVACDCGQQASFHEMRPKQILTALGRVYLQRPYYVCGHCHHGQSPLDRELDVAGTACSPAVRRMMALVGSEGSFEQGRQQMAKRSNVKPKPLVKTSPSESSGTSSVRFNWTCRK